MFNYGTSGCYSLSDIAAATGNNNNNGWGSNGDGWWIIILFILLGNGWGGWGGRGFGGQGGATVREEIAYGFDMNGLENSVRGIQQGLCDGFYAMNTGMLNGFSDVQSALCQGFSGVNSTVTNGIATIHSDINDANIMAMQNTYGLQNAITAGTTALTAQLTNMAADNAACCCETQRAIERGFCDVNYNLATQACDTRRAIADSTRDIIDSNNAGVRSILDFLTQDKIASLTAENQTLKFAASQQAQNAYLVSELTPKCPVPAYVVPNPNCCYDPFRSNCGCNYFA